MGATQYWAVIPAAGLGRRMGEQRPKQYLALGNAMVLEHTLAHFCEHAAIQGVVVGLAPEDCYWSQCRYASHPKVFIARGGSQRYHTVINALDCLAKRADAEDWVLVHDAARPCVQRSDIERLMQAGLQHPEGAILAAPVSDTLKRVDAAHHIQATLPRAGVWRALTPQMFRLGALRNALQRAIAQQIEITDEAAAMEHQGKPVGVVLGRSDNIKITHPEDLKQAALQLQLHR